MSASLILSSKIRHGVSLAVERRCPRRCRRTARTQGGRQDRGRVPRRFQAARPQGVGSDCHPEMDLIKRNYHYPERQGCMDTLVQKFDNRHDSLGAVLIDASEYIWATLICSRRRQKKGPWVCEAAGG